MIRVGFVGAADGEWIGGVNYLANLLHAVHSLKHPRIEPVLFVAPHTPQSFLSAFPSVTVVRASLFDNARLLTKARKAAKRLLRRDFAMERFLQSQGVRVLSHSIDMGRRSPFPTIQWLPDFQHVRLPRFFQPDELAHRNKGYASTCRYATTVLVSSFDARKDLLEFAPYAAERCEVLHFVSGFGAVGNTPVARSELSAKYGIDGHYIHLPNQFWAHKNHQIVLEALEKLRGRGQVVKVVATGHTRDRRQPGHFDALMQEAAARGVDDQFRVLGLVPYEDLSSLMRHAVAILNPSLFEGWSTTVEEAKSMGKTVILSDIPVHREQAPEWGIYFRPTDGDELAAALALALAQYDVEVDQERQLAAARILPSRVAEFGRSFEDIVLRTLERHEIG